MTTAPDVVKNSDPPPGAIPGSVPRAAARLGTAGLVSLVVLELVSGLLQGWPVPLLPALGGAFEVSHGQLNWVSSAYLLSGAVCVPLLAKLGDMFGYRLLLRIATASVVVGTVMVALAPSFEVLLAGRVVQGPMSAFLPLMIGLVRDRAPERAGSIIGILVGALTVGVSLGMVSAGGLMNATGSLGVSLFVPVVVVALSFLALWVGVPESVSRAAGRIDWWGTVTLSIGMVLLLLALGNGLTWGWTSVLTLGCLLGGVAMLGMWVRTALRVPEPLIDLRAVARGGVLPLYVIALLLGAQLFGSQTVIALLAGSDPVATGFGLGLTALEIGGVMTVFGLAAFGSSTAAAKCAKKIGDCPVLVIGAVVAGSGFALLAFAHNSIAPFLLGVGLIGVGNGFAMAGLPAMIVARVSPETTGIATGIYNTARVAAGAAAGAVFAAVFAAFTAGAGSAPGEAAYVWVLALCVGCCAVMAVLTRTIRKVAVRSAP
ncbi:MFS transporter [Streptomyces sp. NPDC087440]|uniref:MFS transporter n=1 Tax=Streptomyces sp. NPDC087440 TaxID=3365790 RepID=UPI0038081FC9